MANLEIRQRIFATGFKYYDVAKELEIAPSTLSTWLRNELTDEQTARINEALKSLIKKRNELMCSSM